MAEPLSLLPPGAIQGRREAGTRGTLYVKRARPGYEWVLEAEERGLAALREAGALRVPEVVCFGRQGDEVVLATEWIEHGAGGARSDALLGAALAAQHQRTAQRFGWERRGTIGRTVQHNDWREEWLGFLREQRLRPQLELLARGAGGAPLREAGERLLESLPTLLAGHRPPPSLLHGDLWGGNCLVAANGTPVVIDPAAYFGDREADLAMTRLFGGFGRHFYEAYAAAAPLPPGHDVRGTLYNLYHVLNHANLFGGGYLEEAQRMIAGLLAETRG